MKGRKCKPDSMIEAAQGMENMMIATRRNYGICDGFQQQCFAGP